MVGELVIVCWSSLKQLLGLRAKVKLYNSSLTFPFNFRASVKWEIQAHYSCDHKLNSKFNQRSRTPAPWLPDTHRTLEALINTFAFFIFASTLTPIFLSICNLICTSVHHNNLSILYIYKFSRATTYLRITRAYF